MPHQCGNCRSLFFKTLETRIPSDGSAIFYKKRCKRCKFKVLVRKELLPGGTQAGNTQPTLPEPLQPITHEAWLAAVKIQLPGRRTATRGCIHTSEYSSRISRAAETQTGYLRKIQQAQKIQATETQCHDSQETRP